MSGKCKHGLVDSIFCYNCYIEKHGKIESHEKWIKRIAKNKKFMALSFELKYETIWWKKLFLWLETKWLGIKIFFKRKE